MNLSWKELAAVSAVGLGLALAGRKLPLVSKVPPVALAAGLYVAGYVVSQKRPAGGWKMLEGAE
jgi:hypothetical protein